MPKLMFYGYVMNIQWLYEWGVKNGCAPKGPLPPPDKFDAESATRVKARRLLLQKAGLSMDAGFQSLPVEGKHTTCLVLTTNEERPPFHLLPKEKYAKLKEVLETEDEPDWWDVSDRG